MTTEEPREFAPAESALHQQYEADRRSLGPEHWIPVLRVIGGVSDSVLEAEPTEFSRNAFACGRPGIILDKPWSANVSGQRFDTVFMNYPEVSNVHAARDAIERFAPVADRRLLITGTESYGYFGSGGQEGIVKAIVEFLKERTATWELETHVVGGGGLTVLKKTWNVETDASRGLGDTVAKVTHATGLAKLAKSVSRWLSIDCGCDWRQGKLNAYLGYPLK